MTNLQLSKYIWVKVPLEWSEALHSIVEQIADQCTGEVDLLHNITGLVDGGFRCGDGSCSDDTIGGVVEYCNKMVLFVGVIKDCWGWVCCTIIQVCLTPKSPPFLPDMHPSHGSMQSAKCIPWFNALHTVHNSTADRFWRTASKLFLLYKLAHVSDGGHNDGNRGSDGAGGGDDV